MKAIFREFGKDRNDQKYVLEDQTRTHSLTATEIRIQVKACALTTYKACLDLLRKQSDLQHPVGQEVSGLVSEVGSEVTQFQIGDRIAALLPMDSACSGCATECVVSIYDTVKLPKDVSFDDAAAAVGDGVRAYTGLFYHGRLCAGDTVLVVDGASSCGSVLIQLATSWGAKVLATSSSKEEKFFLEDMKQGPSQILELQHLNSTLVNTVMEETGGMGVDVIVDTGVRLFPTEDDMTLVGENSVFPVPSKHELISCLGAGGRWVTSHHALQLDPPDSQQLFLKCASVSFLFEHIWSVSGAQYGRFQHILEDIMNKLSQGDIKPNIVKSISLQEAVNVLPELDTHRIGKILVTLS